MKTNERFKRTILKGTMATIWAVLILASIPAAAIPVGGMSSAIRPTPQTNNPYGPRTEDPALVLEQGIEEMFGHELNGEESALLKRAVRELQHFQEQQERPQKVNFVYDLFTKNQFLPIFCFHARGSFKLPKIGNVPIGGKGISAEKTPCVLTNSLNPLWWRTSDFRSYRMKGVAATSAGAEWGGVSAGMSFGMYVGPKNTTRPFVGTYGFFRLVGEKGPISANIMGAYSKTDYGPQGLLMAGATGELGWNALLRFARILPQLGSNEVSVGGIKLSMEGGAYYNVAEHPWFARLISGQNPLDAFSDFDTYVAAN